MAVMAKKSSEKTTDKTLKYPAHIAVIMDGNGRWASNRNLPRKLGHKQGAEALRTLLESCRDLPFLTHLTIYAFSAENWKRPNDEVSDLMALLKHYIKKESVTLHSNGIRLRFIGDKSRLSPDLQTELSEVETLTAKNTGFTLVIALSYGARQEIKRAIVKLASRIAYDQLDADTIDEKIISDALDTEGLPDPDLLIRTGGDQRLSNFLLWQSAYTELYFCDRLWPDFTPQDFRLAIDAYCQRERRFGARKSA